MNHRRLFIRKGMAMAAWPGLAFGQTGESDFPAKSVTMVVPFAAGQSGDIIARAIGEAVSKLWGKPMLVENRGGAGGTLGSQMVARAPADGYTLLLGSSGPTAISPSLYRNVGYDPNRDFTPIVNVAGVSQVLTVGAGSKYKSMMDLVQDARANPGKLSYGSGGTGSTAHLTMELFKAKAGIVVQHVPYKGAAPAYPDLIAGRLDAMFDTTPAVLPLTRSGQIRALAVSTSRRTPSLPNVPTVSEAGLKDFELVAWWGIVGPAGMNSAILRRLNQDFRRVLEDDAIRQRFEGMGLSMLAGTSEEFRRFISAEHDKFAQVIRANNISAD